MYGWNDDVDGSSGSKNVKIVIWTMIKNDGMINHIILNWYKNFILSERVFYYILLIHMHASLWFYFIIQRLTKKF
jgi:hypothetical protein